MTIDKIEEIIEKYKNKRDAVVQLAREILEEQKEVSKENLLRISKQLNIPPFRMFRALDEAKIERDVLKGTRDENFGIYNKLLSAKSEIDGQDGGVVTALLSKGMKKGVFDAAIVVKRKEGYNAEATIAEKVSEIVEAKNSKYLKVRTTAKIQELLAKGKKKIVIVCTPCEAWAARKMQQMLKRDAPDVEVTIIGLFCSEAFNYAKLKQRIREVLDIDLDKAEKTQIRKGKFIVDIEGKEHTCKLEELDEAAEKGCNVCDDFSARLADISVGSVGSQRGYSTVICRSDTGKNLFDSLDTLNTQAKSEEIARLSRSKRERAEKSYSGFNPEKT